MNDFLCPVCRKSLAGQHGNQIHPNDPNFGVVVFCDNRECPAQEVSGHRKDLDDAFEVIKEKFPIDKVQKSAIL